MPEPRALPHFPAGQGGFIEADTFVIRERVGFVPAAAAAAAASTRAPHELAHEERAARRALRAAMPPHMPPHAPLLPPVHTYKVESVQAAPKIDVLLFSALFFFTLFYYFKISALEFLRRLIAIWRSSAKRKACRSGKSRRRFRACTPRVAAVALRRRRTARARAL